MYFRGYAEDLYTRGLLETSNTITFKSVARNQNLPIRNSGSIRVKLSARINYGKARESAPAYRENIFVVNQMIRSLSPLCVKMPLQASANRIDRLK